MKYPQTLTIEITPETDKLAGNYEDRTSCRLCQAIKSVYPKATVNAGAWTVDIDGKTYCFSGETARQIREGYTKDYSRVRKNAKPVTVVATRSQTTMVWTDWTIEL